MFLMSKCRGELDLGLCTTSVLANKMSLWPGDGDHRLGLQNVFGRKICQTRNWPKRGGCGIMFSSTEVTVVHRPRSNSPLHFTLETYGKFARKLESKMLALGVCFPQTCSSVGRMFAASSARLHYTVPWARLLTNPSRFVSTTTNSMKCLVNWIPPRIQVPAFEKYPTPPVDVNNIKPKKSNAMHTYGRNSAPIALGLRESKRTYGPVPTPISQGLVAIINAQDQKLYHNYETIVCGTLEFSKIAH